MMYVGKGREEYPGIISYPDIFRLRPLEKQTNLSESDQFDIIKHTIMYYYYLQCKEEEGLHILHLLFDLTGQK